MDTCSKKIVGLTRCKVLPCNVQENSVKMSVSCTTGGFVGAPTGVQCEDDADRLGDHLNDARVLRRFLIILFIKKGKIYGKMSLELELKGMLTPEEGS